LIFKHFILAESPSVDQSLCVGRNDSAKRHLLIGYGADLTPVVAAKEAGASWNARGMAETVWKLECAVDFPGGKEYDGKASGRTPERWPDTSKDTHGGDQLVLGERATNQ
jgi:hypothetical protein